MLVHLRRPATNVLDGANRNKKKRKKRWKERGRVFNDPSHDEDEDEDGRWKEHARGPAETSGQPRLRRTITV